MIECEKGTVLCLEYAPDMFRKVVVDRVYITHRTSIMLEGMTARFNQETGEETEAARKWFRRKLSPFDQAKIDATKVERHRRSTVKWLQEQDWNAMPMERLEVVYAAATE